MPLEETVQKSELKSLLDKNAIGGGLTPEELKRAEELIINPQYSEEDCSSCKMWTPEKVNKAIYDTNLCQGHASYALITRK